MAEATGADGRPGGLRGSVTAAADLFDEDTRAGHGGAAGRVLAAVAADPQVRLHQMQVLEAAERDQVLAGWNDTAAAVPAVTVPELFVAQAARLRMRWRWCAGMRWSVTGSWWRGRAGWRGICGRAGAGPETVVGLCLERGAELVTAVLGVWLAGAAYLPLDPGYPAARLEFMLADGRAAVLAGHR